MRSMIIPALLFSLLLYMGTDAQNSSLSYEYRKLHKEKKGLKQHDYTPVTVDMSYPYFRGKDSDAEFLNAEVSKYLFERYKTFDKFCSAFFQQHSREAPETMSNWLVEKNISVIYLSDKFVSLGRGHTQQEGYNAFLGTSKPVTYDLKTKKILTLNAVFKGNYKPELTRLVWQNLKRDSKANGNEGVFYEEMVDKYLSEKYYFTGGGIVFSFDWGEIAPRVSPGFEVEVQYKLLEGYLKSGTPVWDIVN